MKPHGILSKIALALGVCALVFGLMLVPALAASHEASTLLGGARSEDEIEATVNDMLAAGDFTEGEAIVCYYKTPSNGKLGDGTGGLLASVEELSTVTVKQYAQAIGEDASSPAEGFLTAQAGAKVEILLVKRDDMSTYELLKELLQDERVLSAEPNYILGYADDADTVAVAANETEIATGSFEPAYSSATSVDLTSYQWMSAGSEAATPTVADGTNPGINSPSWNTQGATNSQGCVVIMDSGVDYTHPDLQNVMYRFSPELQAELGCGEFGYAPIRDDVTDPMDGYGHGTHCAGIVAAEWNGFGVSGVASGAKIIAVSVSRSTEDSGFGYDAIIKGYDFMIRAVEAGVDIRSVNRSLECSPTNTANEAMVFAAGEHGIVTCIASGNNSMDLDSAASDVSMYQNNPYILRVNASKQQDDYAWFTQYGTYTTDVFAPGVAILSTVPSNQETFSRYFPQADNDPLYLKTNFDGADLDVYGTDLYGGGGSIGLTVNNVSKGSLAIDGDESSLAADVTVVGEFGATFYVDVPVDSISLSDIQDLSVALYAPDIELRFLDAGILLDGNPVDEPVFDDPDDDPVDEPEMAYFTSDIEDSAIIENNSFGAPCDWAIASFHLYDPEAIEPNIKYVTDSQGRNCIRLRISGTMNIEHSDPEDIKDVTLYIDRIAIGGRGNAGFLPYQYMNGTSMATPVVTGAAAVVSSNVYGASLAERASQTVTLLKGTVHQADGYLGLCKQNGQIDLSFIGGSYQTVPVIKSAQANGNTIVVNGTNFGSSGFLTIDGIEASVTSWSDAQIVAMWPYDLESGLIHLSVTASTGTVAQRAFILEASENVAVSASVYERDLEPISSIPGNPSITDTPMSLIATESGTLFAAAANGDDSLDNTVKYLYRSDDQAESWNTIELPQELKNVVLAAGEGKVFVLGATPADNPVLIETWYLYAFDIEDGTFELLRAYEHFGDEIGDVGAIVYVAGRLYYVDTLTSDTDNGFSTHNRVRLFGDDYSLLGTYTFIMSHEYDNTGFYYAPDVAVVGNSFYVCNIDKSYVEGEPAACGLERVDIATDGSLSCTDLSEALNGLDTDSTNVCMAACDEGVFLIGSGLDVLSEEGAPRTDTYFMMRGTTTFEPYVMTLSYESITKPCAVCADGWLYAYAVSKYEPLPQFGRATELPEIITGWVNDGDGWYYYDENGNMVYETWLKWNGAWYYLAADGKMVASDWVKWNGGWYYLSASGKMVASDWVKWNGAWYYLAANGKMVANDWVKWNGGWYYLSANGKMVASDWVKWNGAWYYLAADGKMVANDWVKWNGAWYYLGANGKMVANDWVQWNGTWYHFNASGACDRKA